MNQLYKNKKMTSRELFNENIKFDWRNKKIL